MTTKSDTERYQEYLDSVEQELIEYHKKNLETQREKQAKALSIFYNIPLEKALDIIKREQIVEYCNCQGYDYRKTAERGDIVREVFDMDQPVGYYRRKKNTDKK
jgi:dsDNA-binding SOS-regulon protein